MTHGPLRAGLATLALVLTGCVSAKAPAAPPVTTKAVPAPPQVKPEVKPAMPAALLPPPPAADPGFSRPPPGLSDEIAELWRKFPGKTGIAVVRIDGDWQLAWRGNDLFPQQSVSKLWVTLAALDAIDAGRIALTGEVKIGLEDLTLFSQPIASKVRAAGEIRPTVASLIEQAINRSDNTANDSLLRHIGGPKAVRDFIARKRLGGIRFGPGERLLQAGIAGLEWQQSYSADNAFQAARGQLPVEKRKAAMARYLEDPMDGASPLATARALAKLARGELLSEAMTKYALDTLERTRTGPNRLRAGLPAGWRFGNKTGTGQNLESITAGYNDIGIATAPDGTRYAIVVFLADTTASVPARMQLMQAVSRAVATRHGS
jgi:beta-lactamase class A